jgi:hypothetical protein
VIDGLLQLPPGDARFVRGNHDDVFDQVLHGVSYAPNASEGDALIAFQWFLQYGLDSTLASYDASSLPELKERIPETHRNFIHSLEPAIEDPDLFVAHGSWKWNEPADDLAANLATSEAARRRLIWTRFDTAEIVREKAWRRTGYFGHTPVELYPELMPDPRAPVPIRSHRIRLLDTAAALQVHGRLTAWCHEEDRFVQVDRAGKIVEEAA